MDILKDIEEKRDCIWLNPDRLIVTEREKIKGHGFVEVKGAQNRFMRFMPYIEKAFPETAARRGNIESNLLGIPCMEAWLRSQGAPAKGRILLKDDAHLPIAGSVKARGGIHAVLKIAEQLAVKERLMMPMDKHDIMDSDAFREFYSRYTIHVASTGNLGLAVGLMAASFNFSVVVHMSEAAKAWKKELLRSKGVTVIEHTGNYSQAIEAAREAVKEEEKSFFIDDENSTDLFFGYATAAMRIKVQLFKAGIPVDSDHPLFVYLPCGVGGAPGGITFGLKQMFGDSVHCFFVEPVTAPCFTLGMATGKKEKICVEDMGLNAVTVADGLAVSRPSAFVCDMMEPLLSGCLTVSDEELLTYMKKLYTLDEFFLEPSACAGFKGLLEMGKEGGPLQKYLADNYILDTLPDATHLVWATGGGLVPEEERERLLNNL